MEQANAQGLYDIYSINHIPFWQTKVWYIFWSIVLVVLVLAFFYFVWVRFFKRSEKKIPAWDRALSALRALQNQEYETQAQAKQFYFDMTDILKQYIQDRFGFSVISKTDEELLRYLAINLKVAYEPVKIIVQGCLYIKFANQAAIKDQIAKHLEMSIDFITNTIPQEK